MAATPEEQDAEQTDEYSGEDDTNALLCSRGCGH
jgi:hypothetical protein